MAKGKLFEYAVIYNPPKTKEQVESGEEPKTIVITKPITLVAASEKEVSMVASKAIPDEYMKNADNIEILIRPF